MSAKAGDVISNNFEKKNVVIFEVVQIILAASGLTMPNVSIVDLGS